ncbi:MAG: response regulator [Bdellovibrionota bacterium]|nr:response regulator [Bdellovibrionota bacterium]
MATILVVDDSESVRTTLRNILTAADHDITEAVDGYDALEKLKEKETYDLILLDVNMPEMNGMEFIKVQAEDENYKKIPTVMCTTESHPKLILEAKKVGVVMAWLLKPFKEDKLKETIRRIVESSKG